MNNNPQKILSDYQRHLRRERIFSRVQWALLVAGLLLWWVCLN